LIGDRFISTYKSLVSPHPVLKETALSAREALATKTAQKEIYMRTNWHVVSVGFFLAIALAVVSNALAADSPGRDTAATETRAAADISVGSAPDAYGLAATSVYTIPFESFMIDNGADAALIDTSFYRRFCRGLCTLDASIQIPTGALITSFEVEACDTNADLGWSAVFFYLEKNSDSFIVPTGALISSEGTPGCTTQAAALSPPVTIANNNNTYQFEWNNTGATDSSVSLRAVSIFYRLQISPAPATATFSDVPTSHPFFPYIEALGDSGITAGCGGGNYCPDNPLTRGQTAVFLSKALGLYWPN